MTHHGTRRRNRHARDHPGGSAHAARGRDRRHRVRAPSRHRPDPRPHRHPRRSPRRGDVARRSGTAPGRRDRAQSHPVRRPRVLVVHRCNTGSDRPGRGPVLRHRVPRNGLVVRRDALRGRRGRRRAPRVRRGSPDAGLARPLAFRPAHHVPDRRGLRDADGRRLYDRHHDDRPSPGHPSPLAHAHGRAGRCRAARHCRVVRMGGAAVPALGLGPQRAPARSPARGRAAT